MFPMRWTRIRPCCFVDRKSSSPWFFLFISVSLAFLLSLIICVCLLLEVELRALLFLRAAVLFDLWGRLSLDIREPTCRRDQFRASESLSENRSWSREVIIVCFPIACCWVSCDSMRDPSYNMGQPRSLLLGESLIQGASGRGVAGWTPCRNN